MIDFPRASLYASRAALLAYTLLLVACGGGGTSQPSPQQGSGGNTSITTSTHTFANVHQSSGWNGYALLPPAYAICGSCSAIGPQATWSMSQAVTKPSITGSATQFDLGGQTPFADILWNNHLIGDFSSQGMPDTSRSLVPMLHNFIYDVWFYGTNLELSQALEFDINQFFSGKSFIWGHQCRIASGHEWDTWDNVNAKWIPTGVACNPLSNAWNHLTIVVQRTASDQLLFQSIALNGVTSNVNVTRPHGSAQTSWYGFTLNYQMDGNSAQQAYSVWLDQLNFSYQ